MTNGKTPAQDVRKSGAGTEGAFRPAANSVGPLFAVSQKEVARETDAASPYPWDKPGEQETDAEASAMAGAPDNLPTAGEIFDPAAQSEGAGEDPPSGLERLNENIEQLLETVDAVAADVAESRSHLERLTHSAPDDPEAVNGAGGIEDRVRIHTADFHRWDRERPAPTAMVAGCGGGDRPFRGTAARPAG